MQRDAGRCRAMQERCKRCREVQGGAGRCREVQGDASCRHLEAALRAERARRPEDKRLRVGVPVAERAVVGGAKVRGVERVLDHAVPAAREVAHAGRDLPLPPTGVRGVATLSDERELGRGSLCRGVWAATRVDPQHSVLHPRRIGTACRAQLPLLLLLRLQVGQVAARATAVEPPPVVRAQQVPVGLHPALRQRREAVWASVLKDTP
jgi:hypothetical protein